MEQHKTWIRIAGNATMIKAGGPHGWRCYVKGSRDETPLKHWLISGVINEKNCVPGFNAAGDEHGVVAWIDFFGSYKVEGEVLYIVLADPSV